MKLGRNEPCPCGSGKKYKKCCYLKEQITVSEDSAKSRDIESATDDAIDDAISDQEFFLRAINNMRGIFLDKKPHIKEYYRARKLHGEIVSSMMQYHDDGKFEQKVDTNFVVQNTHEPAVQMLDSEFDLNTRVGEHAFFDLMIYKPAPNLSCITEDFIEKHRYRKAEKIEFLQSMLDSKLGLFEVTGTDSLEGYAYLKEVFTGAEYRITDVGLSGDRNYDNFYIYTRIINYRDVSFGTGLSFVFYKTDSFIKDHIRRYKKDYKPMGELLRFTQLYNHYSQHSDEVSVIANTVK
jgi:hypothetical protein